MTAKPITTKLRLRLELIAALPESIMLDRLSRFSVAELTAFRRMYGIRECRCKGRCKWSSSANFAPPGPVWPRGDLAGWPLGCSARCATTRPACTRHAASVPHAGRQSRQFHSGHINFLAALLIPEGETAPHKPRATPNHKRQPRQNAA
jgi:hypothetical protein